MFYSLEIKICYVQQRRRQQLCLPRLQRHCFSFSLCPFRGIRHRECEVVIRNALFCGHVLSHRWIVASSCFTDVTQLLSFHRDIILHVVRSRAFVSAFYLQRRVEHLPRNAGVQLTFHISTKPWFELLCMNVLPFQVDMRSMQVHRPAGRQTKLFNITWKAFIDRKIQQRIPPPRFLQQRAEAASVSHSDGAAWITPCNTNKYINNKWRNTEGELSDI